MHRVGIVHRDFKPSNVIMGPEGPVVIDFGIARILEAGVTSSALVGSPGYMAPEQLSDQPAGPASDMFSWAATMVYAATGHAAFTGQHPAAVMNVVLRGLPDLTGVPDGLRPLLEACLAKDPAARPTAGQVLATLTGHGTVPVPRDADGSRAAEHDVPGPAIARGSFRQAPYGHRSAEPSRGQESAATIPARGGDVTRYGFPGDHGSDSSGDRGSGSSEGRGSDFAGGHGSDPPVQPAFPPPPVPRRRRRFLWPAVVAAVFAAGVAVAFVFPSRVPFLGPGSATTPSIATPSVTPSTGTGSSRALYTGHARAVNAVAVTELDGKPVAVTGSGQYERESAVWVWDLTTRAPVGQPFRGHTDVVGSIAVTQVDSRPIAISGSNDKTVRIWDLATREEIAPPLTGHARGIHAMALTELNGEPVIVTGGGDGQIRVWDLPASLKRD
ncbi:protein kinase domain-containing protein [Planobispora rosea]|uniref:protein kinase domain-containing protein n=1 Tax=Planobispora rosea TaxID=35762 RepID=UPI0035A2496D